MAPRKPAVKAQSKKAPIKSASKGGVIVDQYQDLSPTNPIPFEGGMGFSAVANSTYLPFLSQNDNYAAQLLQSRLLSATHNACITTKKDYCAGNGFQTTEDLEITDQGFKNWTRSMNIKNESLMEINKQTFDYFFTFGNVPIEVARFKVGREKRLFIYVHNFLEWRLSYPEVDTNISTYAIQSRLFLRDNYVLTAADLKNTRKLPIYNPRNKDKSSIELRDDYNWIVDSNGVERTLIWYKNSIAGYPNYGLPSAVASLIYQKLEYKGARFNLDNLDNNMVVSAILALKGSLTQGEITKIGKKVVSSHTGDGKRGRVIVVGSEEGIDGSNLHNFDTQKEGSFDKSDEKWMQKIILANQWDAILAGIVSGSTIGKGVGFLTKIIEVKKNTVIIPAQNDLMDKVWRPILQIAKNWLGFNIDEETIRIKNTIDISGLTDVDITPAVTVDEVRVAKGLPKAEDTSMGKKFLGEIGADQKKGVYVKNGGDPNSNSDSNVQ